MQQDPDICLRSLCFAIISLAIERQLEISLHILSSILFPRLERAKGKALFVISWIPRAVVGNRNFDRMQERRTKDEAKRIYGVWSGLSDRMNCSRRAKEKEYVCVCVFGRM